MKLLLPLFIAIALAPASATAADPKKPESKKPAVTKPAPGRKPAPAAKREKTDMIEEETVVLLKPYDTNGDFEIDVEEFKAIEAEFKKSPKGPLKAFDKANDGTLDAMIDRTGINVKLGSAAPKKKPGSMPGRPAPPPPVRKPAPEPAKQPAKKLPEKPPPS